MPLGKHLYDYVIANLKDYPGNYLEIGVFTGDGFATVADYYRQKTCYAIDPFIEDGYTKELTSMNEGDSLVAHKKSFIDNTHGLSNIVLYEDTSVNFYSALTKTLAETMSISMILIDGSHHYQDVVSDYKLSLELLKINKKGTIVFDDLHVSDVRKAFDELLANHKDIIAEYSEMRGNSGYVNINYDSVSS